MRYLFLDIDGVLNSRGWWHRRKIDNLIEEANILDQDWKPESKEKARFLRSVIDLDPVPTVLLDRWVDDLDLQVIISSTWRLSRTLQEMKNLLGARGFDPSRVIGMTPRLGPRHVPAVDGEIVKRSSCWRGLEIETWIWDAHPNSEGRDEMRIVILDDDRDFSRLNPWHVQTSMENGLLDSHQMEIKKALALPLNGLLDKPHELFKGVVPPLSS